MTKNKTVKAGVKVTIDGKEVETNVKNIQTAMRGLKREMDSAKIGSEKYKEAMGKWKELKSVLEEHKASLKGIEEAGDSMANRAKTWFGQGFTGALSFKSIDLLYNKLSQFRDLFNAREENAANLKALTGLDDANIAWLTEQAGKLSTSMDETGLRVTQSSAEILNAYMLVGSAKPELLGNAEALNAVTVEAMRLSTAAKMDLQDAVKGVTLALNQYGAEADEAAKYVNVLAAGSKAGAADVVAQTAAIVKAGVAASSANIPIEQLVGSIETLAEKGIMNEVAGTGLKSFFLTLEGGAKDCRPSVVGLETALQNLAAKNMDVTQLTKMFGKEAVNVAQTLISSADKVRDYTAAVTGTNTATEQAAINSDTAVAKMAQLQNQVNEAGMALWESLVPAFNVALEAGSGLMNTVSALIGILTRNISVVGTIVGAYALYKANLLRLNLIEKAHNLALALKNKNLGLATAAIRGNTAALATYSTTQKLVSSVTLLFTGHIKAATVTFRAFTAAIAANPFGAILTVVTAVASAILLFKNNTEEATEATEKLTTVQQELADVEKSASQKAAEEATKVQALTNVLHDNAASYDAKRKALQQLQQMVPGYHATLTNEGRVINENTGAIDRYIKQLGRMAMAEAMYEKIKMVNSEIADQAISIDEATKKVQKNIDTYMSNLRGGAYGKDNVSRYSHEYIENMRKNERRNKDQQILMRETDALNEQTNALNENIKKRTQYYKFIREQGITSEFVEVSGRNGVSAPVPVATSPAAAGGGVKPTKSTKPASTKSTKPTKTGKVESEEEKERKRIQEAMAKIDLEYKEKALQLQNDLLNGKITSEADYQRRSEGLEMERLTKLLDIANLEPDKRLDIEDKIIELKLKTVERLEQLSEDLEKANANTFAKMKEDIDDWQEESLTLLEQAHEQGLISEEEYGKKREEIAKEYAKRIEEAWNNSSAGQRGQQTNDTASDLAKKYDTDAIVENAKATSKGAVGFYKNLMAAYNEMVEQQTKFEPGSPEYEQLEKQKKNLIEWFETNALDIHDLVTSLGTTIGEGLAGAITGDSDAIKEAFKNLLMTIIDSIGKMLIAAQAKIVVEGILSKTLAAVDAAKLVAATAAVAAAKAAVNSFDVGGYTGTGQWNEPAGVVHKGEFVANRFALANPAVKRVLDLIDNAQRTGSIANLSSQDIAAVGAPGYAAGGYSGRPSAARVASHGGDADTRRLLRECTLMMRTMKARFDEPIVAQTYLTGRGGIQEAYDLKAKIDNNSKRRNR